MSIVTPPIAPESAEVVVLDRVHHGLVDPDGGSRDLDAALDAARAAERDGASAVVVPASRHWPATAQALAVLLATSHVRVVVGVSAVDADPAALARFAASATRLAGDRLVLQVLGERAGLVADRLRRRWDGPVVVGDAGRALPQWLDGRQFVDIQVVSATSEVIVDADGYTALDVTVVADDPHGA